MKLGLYIAGHAVGDWLFSLQPATNGPPCPAGLIFLRASLSAYPLKPSVGTRKSMITVQYLLCLFNHRQKASSEGLGSLLYFRVRQGRGASSTVTCPLTFWGSSQRGVVVPDNDTSSPLTLSLYSPSASNYFCCMLLDLRLRLWCEHVRVPETTGRCVHWRFTGHKTPQQPLL